MTRCSDRKKFSRKRLRKEGYKKHNKRHRRFRRHSTQTEKESSVKISLSEFSDELNADVIQSQEQKSDGSSKVFNFKAFLADPDALMPKE